MLRLAAHLPDAAVGLGPVRDGLLDRAREQLPRALGQEVARLRVQVDRVEHRAPDVVLVLVVGAVAHPHRPRVLVAGQVAERVLAQALLAADPVHDLEAPGVAGHVGDEVEEVVGLGVEAERVEPPQREGRVAYPGVAVVPVALAAGRLGQRRRGGREHGPGGRVRQPLQGQRAALQEDPPRVVGEVAVADPLAPELARVPHPVVGLVVGGRRRRVGRPRQRGEAGVALLHRRARDGAVLLEAEAQVGGEQQLDLGALGRRPRLSVALAHVGPVRRRAPVVERGLTVRLSSTVPLRHLTVRSRQHSASVSCGGRRWSSARSSRWYQGPMSRASRTLSQPVLVIHVVSSTCVPGR